MSASVSAQCPSVFDAELPTLSYLDTDNPAEAHRRIAAARRVAPIAVGPFGPELLTYELVQDALADTRLRAPLGVDGADHLHAVVSAAIALHGTERLRTALGGAIAKPGPLAAFCAVLGVPREDTAVRALGGRPGSH